jgi:two-component system CheB/CheR fusion protein
MSMRILLIDDNIDDRLMVRRALTHAMPDVDIADVFDAASLEVALQGPAVDAAITDYLLKWTDGLTVLRAIKARLPGTPVIFYTASGTEEIAVEAMKMGAEDYLIKSARHLARLSAIVNLAIERAATRRRLSEVEGDLQALNDALDLGIFEAGLGGELRACNQAFLRLLGCDTIEQARALGLRSLLHGVDMKRAAERGTPRVRRERQVKRADGMKVWLVVRLCLQYRAAQPVVHGIVEDITPRKKLEAALREADQRKDEFLAMLAHELRNPLAAIRTGATIMRGVDATLGMRQHAGEIVERQVRHLARLVDDLLDVARITRGVIELHRERVNLAAVVDRAVEIVQPLCTPRQQNIRVVLQHSPVYVQADSVRLIQATVNVLQNAAKYSAENTVIDVELSCEDGMAYLTVRDYGRGIASEEMPYLFDLFWQSTQTSDRPRGGLGIGLTLAQRIVKLHGGDIEATSAGLGQGSVFTLTLPTVVARGALEESEEPPPPPQSSRKVLIVEDERDVAEAMAMLLDLHGHVTHVVHDGMAAVDAARDFDPDVAFVDIGLPGQDGYAVARALRKSAGRKNLQLYALTGYGDEKAVGKASDAGFDGHLTKPVAESILLRLLRDTGPESRSGPATVSDLP